VRRFTSFFICRNPGIDISKHHCKDGTAKGMAPAFLPKADRYKRLKYTTMLRTLRKYEDALTTHLSETTTQQKLASTTKDFIVTLAGVPENTFTSGADLM
jgi:hypothetical protein